MSLIAGMQQKLGLMGSKDSWNFLHKVINFCQANSYENQFPSKSRTAHLKSSFCLVDRVKMRNKSYIPHYTQPHFIGIRAS